MLLPNSLYPIFSLKGILFMNNCENVKDYLNKTKQKNYLHLDFPISKREQKKLIDNLDKEIFHHRYLPFIRTNIVF